MRKINFLLNRHFLISFVRWYRKWILKECPHFCSGCRFKDECQHDDEWWLDLGTIGYYEKDNYGECINYMRDNK